MRICVVGAGAIGGFLGARLALAGEEVTLIARGAHLKAIRKFGLRIIAEDGTEEVAGDVAVDHDITAVGSHEVVLLALKAHQIAAVAPELPSLFEPGSVLVTLQNGIPWWYFQRHGGPHDGHRLESLDPGGVIESHVEPQRIIGCIAYPASVMDAPGVIRQVEGNRFPVGELDGSASGRVRALSALFEGAGFRSRVLEDIRSEIWLKLWGNMTFNPISALTRATLAEICRRPETRELAATMMGEAQEVAHKLGVSFRHTIEKRIAGAEKVGEHKTSMLQDLEAGKPMEIDALIGVVQELGRLTRTPTPAIDAVHACLRLLDETTARAALRVR